MVRTLGVEGEEKGSGKGIKRHIGGYASGMARGQKCRAPLPRTPAIIFVMIARCVSVRRIHPIRSLRVALGPTCDPKGFRLEDLFLKAWAVKLSGPFFLAKRLIRFKKDSR
jgi:hypothetical protein